MNVILGRYAPSISRVIIYKGHEKHPLFGPYPDNIPKRIAMFQGLNSYRKALNKRPWNISLVAGEHLVEQLKRENPQETLLVIPAGQSSRLDKVFSIAETTFLKEEFFMRGGLGYLNCGSAYWATEKRIYRDLCEEQPENPQILIKSTQLPLFHGVAVGPLCSYPGKKYKVGFFSDAVCTTDGINECTIYLSGGGSFILPENGKATHQKIKVLARYMSNELLRLGKTAEELPKWENAAIMASVGEGAVLLSMFHPYYGPNDIDVALYEKTFPDCGTNWKAIKERLSPLDVRMKFALNMISKLEERDFGA